jgi:sec-independent protein translocase protein TatA
MFNSIGPLEIIIVLAILLLIFGPKRLPGLGKSVGTGLREFKDSVTGDKDKDDDAGEQTALPSSESKDGLTASVSDDDKAPVETPPRSSTGA